MTPSARTLKPLLLSITMMGLVVLASNILVQYPLPYRIGGIDLSELLTWGAFTYPVAFLVTDTTNRLFGPGRARQVVYAGFALGVILSLALADARIALASGTAFLCAQLLDIYVFNRLRAGSWWKAPAVSSLLGSALDTLLFFSIAFAGSGLPWTGWALGDFCAKLLMIALLLYPFKWLVRRHAPSPGLS